MQKAKKRYSTVPSSEKVEILQNFLVEQKASEIKVIDISKISQMTDMVIILTANSARHAKALADRISEEVKKHNYEFLHTEGYESAQWILVDLNDVVIHIFQEEARELYNLEALWELPQEKLSQ